MFGGPGVRQGKGRGKGKGKFRGNGNGMGRVFARIHRGVGAGRAVGTWAARARAAHAGLLLLVLLAAARPAHAHARLTASTPAAGARLHDAPALIRLTFSEVPEEAESSIELVGPDGAEVPLGALAARGPRSLEAAVRGPLAPGTYRVVWRTAAADGHPSRGEFSFTVLGAGPPAGEAGEAAGGAAGIASAGAGLVGMASMAHPGAAAPAAAPAASASHPRPADVPDGASAPAFVGVRAALYAALVALIGAVAFGWLVLGRLGARSLEAGAAGAMTLRAATVGLAAGVALVAVEAARLVAESSALHGAAAALDPTRLWTLLAATTWGRAWLLQLAAAALALFGFARVRSAARAGTPARAGWSLAALAALAAALAQALSGHAASTPEMPALAVVADTLHVLAAAGWLGSLAVTLLAGIPAALAAEGSQRGRLAADIVHTFSPTALACAGVLALTGVIAARFHVGTLAALTGTAYGRTLLLKLALVLVVLAAGAYNWRKVRPSLGTEAAAARLVRSAALELTIALLVLVVTAVLVGLPTPV